MDIPAGFEQWQWQQLPLNVLNQQTEYKLIEPQQPDWQQLNRWFPACTEARLSNYWVCVIGEQTWSFFEFESGRWVLMPIVKPTVSTESPLPLGIDMLSASHSNGYEVYLYFSNKPLGLLQRQLRFRLAQRIERTESLEHTEDLWILKDDDGRLVFSQQGDWTFVTLLR